MNYLNLSIQDLRSLDFLLSSYEERGVWIMLQSFCAMQENGGLIKNAKSLTDLDWMKAIGVHLKDLKKNSNLWHWSHNDLEVHFYSTYWETSIKKKRLGAAKTNTKRWGPRSPRKGSDSVQHKSSESTSESLTTAHQRLKERNDSESLSESQCNVMKGKVRKGKGESPSPPGANPPDEDAPHIPSEAEIREWAKGAAGVDPDYALDRAARFTEKHSWIANGRLIRWRQTILRYWASDREEWWAKKNRPPLSPDRGPRLPSDREEWWTMELDSLNGLVNGMLSFNPPPPEAARAREIFQLRKGYKH